MSTDGWMATKPIAISSEAFGRGIIFKPIEKSPEWSQHQIQCMGFDWGGSMGRNSGIAGSGLILKSFEILICKCANIQ